MNPTSTDGNCGALNSATNATCLTSPFGNCCSAKGYCGSTDSYCGAGCQPGWGKCDTAGAEQTISTTGSCGETATSNTTCLGSEYGDCCSRLGYCGGNSSYCGVGCQSLYGSCTSSDDDDGGEDSTSSTATGTRTEMSTGAGATGTTTATGTATQAISTDGSCSREITCVGSEWGDCCSGHGWCGGNASYCGVGCQPEFGRCSTVPTGLGKGAIAGISVGAAVGGLLVVLGFVVWFLKRRRKGRYTAVVPLKGDGAGDRDGASLGQVQDTRGQGRGPVEMAAATPGGQQQQQFAVEIGQARKVPVEIGQADLTYTHELEGRGRGAVVEPVELPAAHR
ncbi:hypothetical protein ASPACDRAFT_80537 [Aspergillus aculeatus ATCC 16872]|uniref:Chitin-binding type-1 domain-containing protein n=1 Tax=Aspergillus aculeatus (strain ATCC 16872 / CBS 172.66 / WB 5094) TaxID=690307 RepID=A0A1L9WLL4_ASPA1|nr:uncharacterized protein ASPACDRAFT_80537 [Aspergillus aculeatus ATCC 16872]OJJ97052.1 hypothetical protein ASPACDRAFT_80537 [Aspergillus aculeatus ATCC 16872]